jgi:N4-gp56 family major capsid protein
MAYIDSVTTSSDQEKFLAAKLLNRSLLKLVAASICEKVAQPKGTGLTAYFVRYKRMNVPVTTIAEGVDPSDSTFALEQVTVTLDQWGDVLTLTDVSQLTTKHPLVQQAMELLSENAQRVIDREVQLVWLAGTNVQYGDGSVSSRASVTTAMTISNSILHKAYVSLVDAGAPPREGPAGGVLVSQAQGQYLNGRSYVAVCGPQVIRDLMVTSTSFGSWVSVASYQNAKALYNAEVGTWLGFRFVETNFIPKFSMFGNTTAAVTLPANFGTGTPTVATVNASPGTLATGTYYFKVTRKDLLRGFEEAISIEHSAAITSAGSNGIISFTMPSTAGFVYNVYFGSSTGDANLKLAGANIAASATLAVTAVPSSTVTAPANVNPTGTPVIHPVYIHGAMACAWVGLQDLKMMVTGDQPTTDNPLMLKKRLGYKYLAKTVILDQTRLLRLEIASSY